MPPSRPSRHVHRLILSVHSPRWPSSGQNQERRLIPTRQLFILRIKPSRMFNCASEPHDQLPQFESKRKDSPELTSIFSCNGAISYRRKIVATTCNNSIFARFFAIHARGPHENGMNAFCIASVSLSNHRSGLR